MPLDENDKKWLEEVLARKTDEIQTRLAEGQRSQQRRKILRNGNIPDALASLDLRLEELTERVRLLETRDEKAK
jgi:hypothetical protein